MLTIRKNVESNDYPQGVTLTDNTTIRYRTTVSDFQMLGRWQKKSLYL